VDRLVEEANRAGGRDNITAVLFRLEDEKAASAAGASSETAEQTATDIDAAVVRSAASERAPKPGRARRRVKWAAISIATLAVLAGLAVAAVAGIRSVYFVGQNDRGLVTLYRGVPYELPLGIDLYTSQYVSSVQARSLRPFERRRLLDHELRSRGDAANLIRNLEQGR